MKKLKLKILDNEKWWGGTSTDGINMPFDKNTNVKRNLEKGQNQTMPMYLSNKGRSIWSEEPFTVEFKKGKIKAIGYTKITVKKYGETLKDAYLGAMNDYFMPSGNNPPTEFFSVPQYNTWMQLVYDQTQEGVMSYAKAILENGYEPGILMIDEGWQNAYGDWTFDTKKFPEPKKMIDELHKMGFKVMLWIVPFVVPCGKAFIKRAFYHFNPEHKKTFLRTETDHVAMMQWWNGYSATLDMTKEKDREFLKTQLDTLISDYNVDGFKFDGANIAFFSQKLLGGASLSKDHTAGERNIAWNEFGSKYAYHEYKDTFKGGGKRTIQRTRDRQHSWTGEGINTIIPNAILQGILGHPFICPDMIGGGEWTIKENAQLIDQELFVRMAQCSALFPMMQFSWAPWEAVDKEHADLIKKAHDLHIQYADFILELVNDAIKTGEPILRSLEYNYPDCGYAHISDIYMLGEKLLVAPVVVKGQTVREVVLPKGEWQGFDGKTYQGGKTYSIPVTLADLPYFTKI